jgi:type IV secretory pathway TraG/TraD family ATPase VirD4
LEVLVSSGYRRQAPQPIAHTWEVAVLALTGIAATVGAAALAGQAAAVAVTGGGWVWPAGSHAATRAVAGLASGRPGAGLTAEQAQRLPAGWVVYAGVGVGEVTAVALLVAAALFGRRWWRPNDPSRGMATRGQAAAVLGVRRLRSARAILRPDLYPPRPSARPAPAAVTAQQEASSGGRGCQATGALTSPDRPAPRARRWSRRWFRPGRDPSLLGWRLGRSRRPYGVELWVRYDRTAGVFGAQGSGKTLDLLAPALLAHPGPAMATLTKPEDLLLTVERRRGKGPVAVLDPFGTAPGLPELVWDPVAGCVDPKIAERRAKAFAAGTVTGAVSGGRADAAARFYAAETAKVLQGFLHAAALTGRTLDDVLAWVADPAAAEQPAEILRVHPHAARFWDGLLSGALSGSADTVGNTVTTVQQALSLFFQPEIRARCVPGPGRPATDLADLIARGGTVYLLGREDPYASASPLLTAVAEDVLDTALHTATAAPHGRLAPPFLACLDELPSTAPLPTLRVRMANERALGLSFIYATQTWRQMVVAYGEDEARSLFGLTNNLIVFGGGKDVHFAREVSDLIGATRIWRQTVSDGPGGVGTSRAGEDAVILRPEQIRMLPERQALVIAENAPPVIAALRRCLDGPDGQRLLAEQATARNQVADARRAGADLATRTAAAVSYARAHRLSAAPAGPDRDPDPDDVGLACVRTAADPVRPEPRGWSW